MQNERTHAQLSWCLRAITPEVLFSGRVVRTATGCLEWGDFPGDEMPSAPIRLYGTCRALGLKSPHAHRVAYAVFRGPIPPGMSVCHSCDNPGCVEPGHLWLGTNSDNSLDAWQKGRVLNYERVCGKCGASYLTRPGPTGARRCPACLPEKDMEHERLVARNYYHRNIERIHERRKRYYARRGELLERGTK